MRHRPKRENYDVGMYGEYKYQEMLERYCTYLENKNAKLSSSSSLTGGIESNKDRSVLDSVQKIINAIDEQIKWQKEERSPFAVVVITVLKRVRRKAENIIGEAKNI